LDSLREQSGIINLKLQKLTEIIFLNGCHGISYTLLRCKRSSKGRLSMFNLYQLYDVGHAMIAPLRLAAEATQTMFQNPYLPASYTSYGRAVAAGAELIERTTRRFGKPRFDLKETVIAGKPVEVVEEVTLSKPFCKLLHFQRLRPHKDPRVLVVAPLAGHYATLLRGTVEALLPDHDVFITDWADAKHIPLSKGKFDLDDYIAYLVEFMRLLGPDIHVIAVCQPAVPVLIAAAAMAQNNDPAAPRSMTLMGGPIDPRTAKTKVTELAEKRPLRWFKSNVITSVPLYYRGALREVYPGFIQLTGFMSMNLDRHMGEHTKLFQHLVRGDGELAEKHREFYDEYLSVMDVTAEFYLQTVERVFQKHLLPRGEYVWRDLKIDPAAITRTALLTVEGELDDISALGQTGAAHALCSGLPQKMKKMLVQEGVGHYGIFNGRKYRELILPVIRDFIREHDKAQQPIPAATTKKKVK
jgi:poly(3-hydroxybutyrate) depolymerase